MADLTLLGQGQEALRLLDARQPLQAAAVCRRILTSFPKHIDTYVILGRILAQTSRHEEAFGLFQRVLGADPENLDTYIELAGLYERWGQVQEALWHWQRAFELMPGNQVVRHALERLTSRGGPVATNPFVLTRAALARVYLRGQSYGQAARELSELVSAEPQRYDLRAALVEALERAGSYDAATIAAQSLLEELPYCLKANLVLGKVWLNTAKDDQARVLLQRAQMLDPENRVAHALFGARSPLPLRIPRLPFKESDAEPIELPYLVDDEDIVAESIIIDGQAGPVESETTPSASEPAREWQPPETRADERAAEPQFTQEEKGSGPSKGFDQDRRTTSATPEMPTKMSLIDVQRQYLLEHADDHQARLDLARQFRDMGYLDEAMQQYQILVEASYEVLPAVVHDLELLARLYPSTPSIENVLVGARERDKRVPPVA